MKNLFSTDIGKQPRRLLSPETTTGTVSEPLEVNVIFTEPQATAVALESARSFARGLGACIRLRAVIVVPVRLPLEQPPISVRFMEQCLRNLAGLLDPDGPELTIHLYVCRNQVEALLQVLKPNSLVVIGGRKHWWPTMASQMAGALRANGRRVTFVNAKEQTSGSQQ